MKNTIINRIIIQRVAQALGELNNEVIYVGGATVSLYINDPAADDVRPTKDIDISIKIISITHLEEIREKLVEKGFKQSADLGVICRFKLDNILVDVMGTKPVGWAPANPWFELGFEHKEQIQLDEHTINIMPLPYFLASKFVAHADRGGNDPRMSHDFEDIIYILDNRTDWHEIVISANNKVKAYLLQQFQNILESNRMQEAILGNLYYETQETRYKMIMTKIQSLFK
ncbi:hypothetical protein [Hwangdonia lutea]|uniref:Uncharacterized protein n=1 Tax=Hwangdonia lutea TaxID=3075823 RepID=A0AA97HS67_9FLAO|nr:hypothetical protein [Hwangdonia sp. SCSIO 19198]WOD44193.1 hypothetical protein RNZ46_02765 [Hwangdonia sp. SCSIO 19198]